jgi:hypothetical protein
MKSDQTHLGFRYHLTMLAACATLTGPMVGCGKKALPKVKGTENLTAAGTKLFDEECKGPDWEKQLPADCPEVETYVLGGDSLGGQAGRMINWSLKCASREDSSRYYIISAASPFAEIPPVNLAPRADGVISVNFTVNEPRDGYLSIKCRDVSRCEALEAEGTNCRGTMDREMAVYDRVFSHPYKIIAAETPQQQSDAFFEQFQCEPVKKKKQGLKNAAMLFGFVTLLGAVGGVLGGLFSKKQNAKDAADSVADAQKAEDLAREKFKAEGNDENLAKFSQSLEASRLARKDLEKVDSEKNNWMNVAETGLNGVKDAFNKFVPQDIQDNAIDMGIKAILGNNSDDDLTPNDCLQRARDLETEANKGAWYDEGIK